MKEYTIDSLIKTFKQHSIEVKQLRKSMLKQWKDDFPDDPIPKHMKEDFCVTDALGLMCKEIKALKEKK